MPTYHNLYDGQYTKVVLTDPFYATGTGSSTINESEWVSPYSYNATAPAGSLTSDSVWTIARIEVYSDGSTNIKYAVNVKWDDRLTAIYS